MIAIETKYLGPTNTHGSRIKAYTENHNIKPLTIDYPQDKYAAAEAHSIAALALAKREGWLVDLIGAATSTGYVFVLASSERFTSTTTTEDYEAAQARTRARLDALASRMERAS